MTTSVTVTTVDWPVQITSVDEFKSPKLYRKYVQQEIVDPNSKKEIYVTQTMQLSIKELPLPKQDASAAQAPVSADQQTSA